MLTIFSMALAAPRSLAVSANDLSMALAAHAVVSTYESQDIIKLVCDIDPGAVINVFHTLNFVGGWWGGHVDEPMPTAVPDPDKPARMASRQARLSEQDSLQQDDGK